MRRRFEQHGPWQVDALPHVTAAELAELMDQDPAHELMAKFEAALADLGHNMQSAGYDRFTELVDHAGDSAVALVQRLSGSDCFADSSDYADTFEDDDTDDDYGLFFITFGDPFEVNP